MTATTTATELLEPSVRSIVDQIPAHFIDTSTMSREEWLELRRSRGIGGSDISGILGISKYSSPFRVFREKMGLEEEVPDNDAMWFGREIEPAMAERFSRESGLDVHHVRGMFADNEHPFLFANVDRFVTDAEGSIGILEIKTTTKWNADTWDSEVDPAWLCQVYHYMGITGTSYAYIAFLIDREFGWIRIERDIATESNIRGLRDLAIDFYNTHILTGVAPDPATADEAAEIWRQEVFGKEVEATSGIYARVMELAKVKADIKALTAQEKDLKDTLAVFMQDAEMLTYNGEPLVSYKTVNRKGYEVKPTSYRQLTMKFKVDAD